MEAAGGWREDALCLIVRKEMSVACVLHCSQCLLPLFCEGCLLALCSRPATQRAQSHRTCLSARMADFTMPMQPVGIGGGGGGSGGSMGADYGTLDEPVTETIMRDVRMVGNKMMCVLNPRKANIQTLKDWDLWGPLILCLMLATLLSWFAPYEQKSLVFASVFVIVWCGAAVVTVNALLLGGNISFFQSVCVLGYCIFPLNIASIVCLVGGPFFWRILVVAICFFWSTGASLGAPPAMAPAADGPLHARAHDPLSTRHAAASAPRLTRARVCFPCRLHGRARAAQPQSARRVSALSVLHSNRLVDLDRREAFMMLRIRICERRRTRKV